jgi:PAS domain S-box-containing protein
LIVVAILGQTWWSIRQDRVLTTESAQANSYLAVRVLEEHASRVLQDAVRAMGAAGEEIKDAGPGVLQDEAAMRQILVNQRQDSLFLQSIAMLDMQGRLWATSFQFPAAVSDLSSRSYVKFLLQHPEHEAVMVGAPVRMGTTDRWVLPVARNIRNLAGQQVGIIEVDISLSYLNEFYERVAQSSDAMISLHDHDGNVIIRSPFDERYLGKPTPAAAVAERLRSDPVEGVVQDNPTTGGNSIWLYTYRKMSDFPITVVYARDMDHVLQAWGERAKQRLALAAITIAGVAMLVAMLAWNIRRLRTSKTKLSASENRYRLLYQGAQDAILLINHDYVYVDCNPAALRLFGVDKASEVIGRRAGVFSPDKQAVMKLPNLSRDRLVTELVDAAFEGESQRFEWVSQRDGRSQYNEITLSRVEVEQETLLFCVMRDINARKYAQHLLEGQNHLLQMIGSGDDLRLILEAICQFVERLNTQWHCGVQLLSDDQRSFSSVYGTSFPEVLKSRCPA